MEKNLELRGKKEMESKSELTQRRPVFIPAVDIFENKEALVLIADMPGVTNDGVEIHLEDSELTIRGKVLEEQQNVLPVYTEYRSGDYYRSFTLSNVIDQQKIEASMKDGVLKIILPKAETAKPRQITVQVG
ncbi:MAG: Hsp20/alpha crystallin family protein [Deltaproteobacteria bacterium]|nr:Hsp20/alpha crystallin family protein [Deltaproteobacteria bacterium]